MFQSKREVKKRPSRPVVQPENFGMKTEVEEPIKLLLQLSWLNCRAAGVVLHRRSITTYPRVQRLKAFWLLDTIGF